jgi:hypothetical protein
MEEASVLSCSIVKHRLACQTFRSAGALSQKHLEEQTVEVLWFAYAACTRMHT